MTPAPSLREALRDQRLFLMVAAATGVGLVLVPGWGGSVATWGAIGALWVAGTVSAAVRSRGDERPWLMARVGTQNAGLQLLVALPGMLAGTVRMALATDAPWTPAFVSNALVTLAALPALSAVVLTCLALVVAVPLHDLLRRQRGAALLALALLGAGVVGVVAGRPAAARDLSEGPSARPRPTSCAPDAAIEIDHVPVAAADLEEAAALFRALGFTLKPGRPHANGLRNVHAKFRDGREIELITADRAGDELAARYREWIAQGSGPVFLAFHAGAVSELVARLEGEAGGDIRVGRTLVSFPPQHRWGHLFFGQLNASPTDRPEHFEHANGAETLEAVWVAGEANDELALVAALGGRECAEEAELPAVGRMRRLAMRASDLLVLPARHRVYADRPLVGLTVRVGRLDEAIRSARTAGIAASRGRAQGRESLVLDLRGPLGLWLEFRATED